MRVPGSGAGAAANCGGADSGAVQGLHAGYVRSIVPGADRSLGRALQTASAICGRVSGGHGGKGLLFAGIHGLGKTHLAVGVLQRLVRERGAKGLFCDYRELLKSIQNSYNPEVRTTELELLKPVFAAEVLVSRRPGRAKTQ